MERIVGKSLSQMLERPAECPELIKLAKGFDRAEVTRAIEAYLDGLHERKITHNDLFKRNIMFDENGRFFIIDFGKAKREEIGEDHEDARRRDIELLRTEVKTFFQELDKIDETMYHTEQSQMEQAL
jgi:tRNA A-37 threonylcarbamoyl transferase component Bud32